MLTEKPGQSSSMFSFWTIRTPQTGSTSGIGLGIARALAPQGCSIMMNGVEDAVLNERLPDEMATYHGVTVSCTGADMARPVEIEALISDTVAKPGGIDIWSTVARITEVADSAGTARTAFCRLSSGRPPPDRPAWFLADQADAGPSAASRLSSQSG